MSSKKLFIFSIIMAIIAVASGLIAALNFHVSDTTSGWLFIVLSGVFSALEMWLFNSADKKETEELLEKNRRKTRYRITNV